VLAGAYGGSLDNGGETLRLEMPGATSNAWVVLDEVRYDDDPPWPAEADGLGLSLQLVDASRDNNRVGNWAVTDLGAHAEWKYRSVTGTATFDRRTYPDLSIARVHFYLEGAGEVYLDDVQLVQGAVPGAGPDLLDNGDFETLLTGPWTVSGNHAGSRRTGAESGGGSYSLLLRAAEAGNTSNSVSQGGLGIDYGLAYTLSYWYLTSVEGAQLTAAVTLTDLVGTHSTQADPVGEPPATPGEANNVNLPLAPFPDLWINEVMPSNTATVADNAGEFEPWVELYNADTAAMDLTGHYLSNEANDLRSWPFPAAPSSSRVVVF